MAGSLMSGTAHRSMSLMSWLFVSRSFVSRSFRPWAALRSTVRSAIGSTVFLASYRETSVEENNGVCAIGLDDVRFIDALITSVLFCPLNRRAGVLRHDCCFNLCRCIAGKRLFSGAVHVMTIRGAGSVWGLSSPVGVLALLRLRCGCRSSL